MTRISSLSALVAAALAPVWALFLGRAEVMVLLGLLALLIFVRHAANISRLLRERSRGSARSPG